MKDGPAMVILTRRHRPFSNIILGVGIYLIGFLISVFYNAPLYFLRVPYFSLGCIGIIWVTSMWCLAFASIEDMTKEIETVFDVQKSCLNSIIQDFVKRVSDDKRLFLSSVPGFVFVAYHLWLVFTGRISIPYVVPKALQGNIVFGSYVAVLFSLCIYLIFISVYGIVSVWFLFSKIEHFTAKINLLQTKRKVNLEKTIRLLLLGTISYFVGVSLAMTILFAYTSAVILIFLAFVVASGLSFFLVPQIYLHRSIKRSKENLLAKIESEFSAKTTIPLSSECDVMEGLLLCTLFDRVDNISEWPMDFGTLFKLASSVLVPVAAALIGIV